jgi:hypothetical protein
MTDPVDECQGTAECPWNDRKSERWLAAVDQAPWQPRGRGEFIKELDCPRCGDLMWVPFDGGVVVRLVAEIEEIHRDSPDFAERAGELAATYEADDASFEEPSTRGESITKDTVPARCNCNHEHKGQPDRKRGGCGQWGVISAPGSA